MKVEQLFEVKKVGVAEWVVDVQNELKAIAKTFDFNLQSRLPSATLDGAWVGGRFQDNTNNVDDPIISHVERTEMLFAELARWVKKKQAQNQRAYVFDDYYNFKELPVTDSLADIQSELLKTAKSGLVPYVPMDDFLKNTPEEWDDPDYHRSFLLDIQVEHPPESRK